MKVVHLVLAVVVVYLQLKVVSAKEEPHFTKILWVFWDKGDQLSLFTHLCVNNMRHFANISGWEFKFLTD